MKRIIICIFSGLIVALCCIAYFPNDTEYINVNLKSMADYYIENDSIRYEPTPYVYDKNIKSRKLRDGLVRDKATAIEISRLVIRTISMESDGEQYVPYEVSLSGDSMWIVRGAIPGVINGGGIYVEIRKQDGCILRIIGEK